YPGSFPPIPPRVPIPKSLNPSRGKRESSVRAKSKGQLDFGSESIDLRFLEVLSNMSQTRCIGDAILWLLRNHILDGAVSLAELKNNIDAILEEQGPGALGNEANRTSVRGIDVARVINRMRMANFHFVSAD
ncbi:MAG: hypothetical protein VX278_03495, partial [Myxococcota bacterium]|nr:hypothetical protein [Myxococcota bacterium]